LNEELIYKFKIVKEVEEGLAKSTLNQYIYDLNLFERFVLKNFLKIDTNDIRDFLVHLKHDREYQKITLARKISTLRTFYSFLVRENYLKTNPMDHIKTPKLDSTLPIIPKEKEIRKLFYTATKSNSEHKIRDLAILGVLVFTGARIKGIHNLNVQDVDFKKETLRLVSKGGKHRYVKISPTALDMIRRYLNVRPKVKTNALFLSRLDNRLAIRTIQNMIKKYREIAEINPAISCHKLRHFFATTALSQGMDIRVIQQQLGHSKLSTKQK
jgi:site-specific recombinase XerD